MGLFDHWPYTNFHELNLSWILRLMEELSNKVDNFVALNTIKYADPIQWNITTQYEGNTVVVDPQSGTAYISSRPVPAGVALTNTDYWSVIFTLDMISANDNITLRDDGSNVLSTFSSVAGDWLLWNGDLYRVSQTINTNEAYVVGYNLTRYTVEMFIKDYIDALMNIIGDLDDLTTSDTSSVVNAINSLVTAIGNISGNIGDLDDLITVDKSSIVNAINESIIWTTPEMFGAVGDGVTDDTIAVQNAVTSGNIVVFNNSYLVKSPINLHSNITIIGTGSIELNSDDISDWYANSTFKASNIDTINIEGITINSNCFGILIQGCYNVSLRDLTFTTGKFAITLDDTFTNYTHDVSIENIFVNNGTTSPSSDGVHINGGCYNISVNNASGTTADDFIALNAIEGSGAHHTIQNVRINNIECPNAIYGLRIYGNNTCSIEDVIIENSHFGGTCAARIINTVNTFGISSSALDAKNIIFNNCIFEGPSPLSITNVVGNAAFKNCDFEGTTNPCIRYNNGNSNFQLDIESSTFTTSSQYLMQDNSTGDTTGTTCYINARFKRCTLSYGPLLCLGDEAKKLEFIECTLATALTVGTGIISHGNLNIRIVDSTCNASFINTAFLSLYLFARNITCTANTFLANLPSNNNDLTLDIKDIYMPNTGATYVNFVSNSPICNVINLEGTYATPTNAQKNGVSLIRADGTGTRTAYVYKNAWVQIWTT